MFSLNLRKPHCLRTCRIMLKYHHCVWDLPLVKVAVSIHASRAPNSWRWNLSLKRDWNCVWIEYIIFTVDCTFLA